MRQLLRLRTRKAEIEQWEKTRDDAKARGWQIILDHAEKRLEELKPSKSPELEAARGTKTVISARVTLVNSHENKTKALETKCTTAAKAIEKHKEQLEKALDLERERHTKTMKAHQEDFARMIKEQEEVIRKAEEELRTAKVEYEQADEKINGYISKHLPAEPDITPDTLNKEAIVSHILGDENIKGLMNLESETVVQSLCNLLNVIAQQRTAKEESDDDYISDMELDEKEEPPQGETKEEAASRRRLRRKIPKEGLDAPMTESTRNEAGKRGASTEEKEDKPAKDPKLTEEAKAAKLIELAAKAQAQKTAKEAALKAAEAQIAKAT